MAECLFCRLVSGQAEVSIVHEDERTVTLMDIPSVTKVKYRARARGRLVGDHEARHVAQIPRGRACGRDQDPRDRCPARRGPPLFDQLPQRIELEQTGLSQTDGVTHLEYRVVR